jgi:hypothetical protein
MMPKWNKETYKLRKNHQWRAKPGYKIFVADRGAVRFDIPENWILMPEAAETIEFRDAEPPDDTCGLQVTIFRFPTGIDWSELPLPGLLEQSLEGTDEGVISRSPVRRTDAPGAQVVWVETRFVDPEENREAISRTGMARDPKHHLVMTLSYWPEDAERLEAVWDEILDTLRLGEYIRDPTRGPG